MNLQDKPCVRCGKTERYKNGRCKPCGIELGKKIRSSNKEKISAKNAKWYAENKEKSNKSSADWHAKNRDISLSRMAEKYQKNRKAALLANPMYKPVRTEARIAYLKKWWANNSELSKIYKHRRRSIKAGSDGLLTKGLSARLYKIQRGLCPCCMQPLGENYHMDHIMPLHLGGSNTDENIQLLRQTCNSQKSSKHPVEFMQSRGFLI